MMKWNLMEQFKNQGGKFKEIKAKYDQAVKDSAVHLQNCRAELDAVIKEEFQTGQDMSAKKAAVREKIEKAEKGLEAAEMERSKANEFVRDEAAKDRITIPDLVRDWNSVYRPLVREEKVKPILERMANARSEYINAIMDYYDLVEEYQFPYSEFKEQVNDHYRIHGHDGSGMLYPNQIVSLTDLPQITDEELYNLKERKQMPNGVKRVKGANK